MIELSNRAVKVVVQLHAARREPGSTPLGTVALSVNRRDERRCSELAEPFCCGQNLVIGIGARAYGEP